MMKTLLFLLGFWVLLGLVQCTKEDDPVVPLGGKIELKKTQSARVATTTAPVQLTVTDIVDSRCPIGVNCFWPGQAEVTVELRDKAGTTQQADLCLGTECKNDSAAVVLDAEPYWLRLATVDPYPVGGYSKSPIATLYLTRK